MKLKKESIPAIATILFLILSIVGVGSGVYFYRQFKVSEEKLKNPAEAAKLESKELMKRVGKYMVLPNEEAQVMTVVDVENLKKTQQFFQDAKDNDKLLVFPVAKKAVLFRPSANIIVNVAPIIGADSIATGSGAQQAVTPNPEPPLKIALRNGSGSTGITKKLEDELNGKMKNIVITEKDNAKRLDYEKTLLVAVSETLNNTFIQQLAKDLSASVSALPPNETKPDADILIIAGKDRK